MRNPLLHTNSWDHPHHHLHRHPPHHPHHHPRHHSQSKKSVSVDDLNDALMEETTDESEAEGELLLDFKFHNFNLKIQL